MSSRVNETKDSEAPLAMVVDNNQMNQLRIAELLRQREFKVLQIEDGDKAVAVYYEQEPDLVLLALDIPSLDGHVAGLEIRELDAEARLVFMAPRRLKELAEDAAFSAGAVAWLEKPITGKSFDEAWETITGPIPNAPGLEDLDELYPEIEREEEELEISLPLPPPPDLTLPLPAPNLPPPVEVSVKTNETKAAKKARKKLKKMARRKGSGRRKLAALLLVIVGLGGLALSIVGTMNG